MTVRLGLVMLVTAIALGGFPVGALAAREDGTLRDAVYVSPTWGYAVRWYGDEWTIDEETSEDGVDTLWLADADGNLVGFEGRLGYGGDARSCLDDLVIGVQDAPAASDVALVRDEFDRPQKIFHPWRSWVVLLVGYEDEDGGEVVDHLVYLDCRTLRPGQAVFIRYLVAPVETYPDDLAHLDVLNAALPRGAWWGDAGRGLSAPGLDFDWTVPPLPADSLLPWEYPDEPKLLASADGAERAMLTQVDGDREGRAFVVTIENTGAAPLTIDPERFAAASDPATPSADPDVAPRAADWDDGAPAGPRTIEPGAWASLTLEFPAAEPRSAASFLIYRDDAAADGAVVLDCLDTCGYGSGGTRPRLRLTR